MNPIVRTYTKEDMSAAKEGQQEDTMRKEINCNSPNVCMFFTQVDNP